MFKVCNKYKSIYNIDGCAKVFNGQHHSRIKYTVLAETALGLFGIENNGLHVW